MTIRATLLAALLLLTPSIARAVTFEDIVALSNAGVTADILVAVIDADRTLFTLTPDEILVLKNAGVPAAVIVKMLRSAREFGYEAPPPLIVGHDPAPAVTVVVPTFIPFPYVVVVGGVTPPQAPPAARPAAPGTRPAGFGRFMNDGWIDGRGFARFVNTP